MNKFTFKIIYIFLLLFSVLPYRIIYIISDFLFILVVYVFKYRKKVVLNNLGNAFPNKSLKEKKQIAKKFYQHLCDLILEFVKMISANEKTIQKRCYFEDPGFWQELSDKYENIIIVVGHMGNWEYASAELNLRTGFQPVIIYKPLSNVRFNDLVINVRKKFGAEMVSMKNTFRAMKSFKDNNRNTCTVMLSDQSPGSNDVYWTNFLNQDTAVFKGAEKLAMRFNFPVVYGAVKKEKRGVYKIYGELLFKEPKKCKEGEITEKHTKMLEKDILKQPETWLWSHRRWKKKKPL